MSVSNPVVFVAGARPNFMKVAPMLRAMTEAAAPFERVLVHTGQHYDAAMSDVFFRELGMPAPDVHLNAGSGSHGDRQPLFDAILQIVDVTLVILEMIDPVIDFSELVVVDAAGIAATFHLEPHSTSLARTVCRE